MQAQCQACGESSPENAFFCAACGAVLQTGTGGPLIRPILAIGPTVRLAPEDRAILANPRVRTSEVVREALISFGGFVFAILFLFGLNEFMQTGGLPVVGLWPLVILTIGALQAQEAWVNGDLRAGARGMLLWGGMIWLLAANRAIPWAVLLVIGWAVLRIRWRATRR